MWRFLGVKLTWLGRSCFLLTTRDHKRVIFDPYLDLCQEHVETPFPPPDVICVSHGHLDHFADVPDLVHGDSPTLVIPHHYRPYGRLPAADLDVSAQALHSLAPGTKWRSPEEMESINL